MTDTVGLFCQSAAAVALYSSILMQKPLIRSEERMRKKIVFRKSKACLKFLAVSTHERRLVLKLTHFVKIL